MTLARIYPASAEVIGLDAPDGRERLSELYRPERASWLRVNLIASVSGSAAGGDGTSETLTNRVDRTLL
ncbi:MAG: dihydrofolate reductase family protein, partial [Lacisediminihabitans sp.]